MRSINTLKTSSINNLKKSSINNLNIPFIRVKKKFYAIDKYIINDLKVSNETLQEILSKHKSEFFSSRQNRCKSSPLLNLNNIYPQEMRLIQKKHRLVLLEEDTIIWMS